MVTTLAEEVVNAAQIGQYHAMQLQIVLLVRLLVLVQAQVQALRHHLKVEG